MGWEHRYRRLEEGETIKLSDELQMDDGTWRLTLPQPSELVDLIERLESHMGKQDPQILLADCREAASELRAQSVQIAKLQADGDKLAGAATALRDDMLMRAEMRKRRNNGELVVEAGNGVWHRINEALTEWEDRA